MTNINNSGRVRIISKIVRDYNALCKVIKNPNYWIPEQTGFTRNGKPIPSRNMHLANVKKNKNKFNKIVGRNTRSSAQLVALLAFRPMAELRALAEIVEVV